MPEGMSYAEGASFSVSHRTQWPADRQLPHFTAVQTLYMRWDLAKPSAPVQPDSGKIILVWGGRSDDDPDRKLALIPGSTAVGHHAVQLLHLSGYTVFVTASLASHDRLRQLGASQCFDYKEPTVVELIKSAAGKDGIAAAYDTAASGDSTLQCIGQFFELPSNSAYRC